MLTSLHWRRPGGRLLLTEDKDFGDLVFRRRYTVPGIVLMRVGSENIQAQMLRLSALIDRYGERLLGQYVVVEMGRFRIRRL